VCAKIKKKKSGSKRLKRVSQYGFWHTQAWSLQYVVAWLATGLALVILSVLAVAERHDI